MEFDKPKVTIDLEEYQYLKQKAEDIEVDSMTIAARKILWHCAVEMGRGRGDMNNVRRMLQKEGISFVYMANTTAIDSWESIDIKLEKVK